MKNKVIIVAALLVAAAAVAPRILAAVRPAPHPPGLVLDGQRDPLWIGADRLQFATDGTPGATVTVHILDLGRGTHGKTVVTEQDYASNYGDTVHPQNIHLRGAERRGSAALGQLSYEWKDLRVYLSQEGSAITLPATGQTFRSAYRRVTASYGHRFAYEASAGGLPPRMVEAKTGRIEWIGVHGENQPVWSPGSPDTFAVVRGNGIYLWEDGWQRPLPLDTVVSELETERRQFDLED